MAEHRVASAARTVVIVQIEDIDALFISRIDLTVALGCASPDDPRVIAACDRVVAAAVAARRSVGMFLARAPAMRPPGQARVYDCFYWARTTG